jgi:hypothetical protein
MNYLAASNLGIKIVELLFFLQQAAGNFSHKQVELFLRLVRNNNRNPYYGIKRKKR